MRRESKDDLEIKAFSEFLVSLSNVFKKNNEWVLHDAFDHLLSWSDCGDENEFFVSELNFQYLFFIIDSAEHIINLKKRNKDSKDTEGGNTVLQRLVKHLTLTDPPRDVLNSGSRELNYANFLVQMLIIKDMETQLSNFSKRVSYDNPMSKKSTKFIDFTRKFDAYFQIKQRLASIINMDPRTLNFRQIEETHELIEKFKIDNLLEVSIPSLESMSSLYLTGDIYTVRKFNHIHLLSICCAIMLNNCNAARQFFLKASETVFNRQSCVFNIANQISPLSSLILPNDEGDSVLTLLFQYNPISGFGKGGQYSRLYFNNNRFLIGEIILDDMSVSDYLKKWTLTLCSSLFSYKDTRPSKAYVNKIAVTLCKINQRLYFQTRHEQRFLINPDKYEYVPLSLMKKVYSMLIEECQKEELSLLEDSFFCACLAKSINGRNKQNLTDFQEIFNLYSPIKRYNRVLDIVFNKEDSALCAAIQNKYIDAINYFLDLISNNKLEMTCAAGWQWFSLAIEAGDPEIISSLISFLKKSPLENLNSFKNDKTKKTILDLGLESNNSKIIDLLAAAGFEKSIVPIFTPPPPVSMFFPENKREIIERRTSTGIQISGGSSSSEDSKRASTDSDRQHSESPDTSMTLFPSPHNKKRKQPELESKQEVSESSSQSQNKCSRPG